MTTSSHPADEALMDRAMANANSVRGTTAPNPWVGAVLLSKDGEVFDGATRPVGGAHAERSALEAAGQAAHGATLATTLEPCCHVGRTEPCVDHIIEAGVARVLIGVTDPDPHVAGGGIRALRDSGIEVVEGVQEAPVTAQLEPYLHHRRTGRPWVVLKMALTLDGRTAAPDGSSQWITSEEARLDGHALRARCDAILVGAGTVRSDDPSLTVRDVPGTDPQRIVLGQIPADAAVHPCWEMHGELKVLLEQMGEAGVVDLLVEGGANVAAEFHRQGIVNEYVLYLAPALMGGDDGRPVFVDSGSATMSELWRGELRDIRKVGVDLRIELRPIRGD
ncbi:MAG: bifunctional diaminohydroxyphosphoribosylaminopyrimidine deaminase/5-amino-6-(5-phosphoribosylamino)uracil reductase RibD [Actinomycetota bacterium]|nr:bifunctional diaminohydroxyphosphoribosylaminopyrimidine deaminase/5-amino-6-(5-phosphoribosylamino)uracil reductase RibD [Actinomycetota bacterium]